MLTAPVALVALLAGALTVLLPRLGWIALTAYLCGVAAIQGAAGAAALVAAAMLVPMVLLPAGATLWPVAAAAPALGYISLAGAWPALAGYARSPWRRMMLGAIGWLWLAVAAPLAGHRLYEPRPRGTLHRAAWTDSVTHTVDHVISPLIHTGVLAGAVPWAAAAILAPWAVRRRSPLLDAIRAIVWAALLTAAVPLAIAAAGGSAHGSGAPSAIEGAVAAAVLVLGPLAVDQVRRTARSSSLTRRVS